MGMYTGSDDVIKHSIRLVDACGSTTEAASSCAINFGLRAGGTVWVVAQAEAWKGPSALHA